MADDHSHDQDDMQRWKNDGARVIPGDQLDPNVPSTAGMDRKAAVNFARVGAHHHGHLESIIYGRAWQSTHALGRAFAIHG